MANAMLEIVWVPMYQEFKAHVFASDPEFWIGVNEC